jgi:hypothetical protein
MSNLNKRCMQLHKGNVILKGTLVLKSKKYMNKNIGYNIFLLGKNIS